MPDGQESAVVRVLDRIGDLPAEEWDACAGPNNPFVSHAFLLALEGSGSVSAEAGWLPQHLALRDCDGRLLGAVPLYLKSHSYGEYIFDWGWADAYERAGGTYYPKLQCAIPFTPVAGPRLLIHPEADRENTSTVLIASMVELARRHKVSSLHVTFATEQEFQEFGDAGLLQRIGMQYHWQNRGYRDFDDFLADLVSRKRKAIKKERRQVADQDIRMRILTGDALREEHWRAFYRFYLSTADKKWGHPYLNQEFFLRLGASMADRIALVVAEKDGQIVAGALNLIGTDALYGRNWGCLEDFRFLHFEACYYQAIEFAIQHGLQRVEAGAQGEHKIQRGYLPCETYSAHWIADPGFRDAVEDFVKRERLLNAHQMRALEKESPFRAED